MLKSLWDEYRYFADKRFSTLSGTLVYFLLMSVTPFLFWLTLLAGDVDLTVLQSNEAFSAVAPVIAYLQTSAKSATAGAGIILVVTSLWSSTNFFYHLRRSGEIIYEFAYARGGVKLRFSAVLAVFAIILVIAASAALPVFSASFLAAIMPDFVANAVSTVFLLLFAFIAAYLLNAYACPFRLSFSEVAGGVFITLLLWIFCSAGFSVYMHFSNPQKLYGAIAAVIVFLFWCYLMVNSLIIGIIYNGRYAKRGAVKKIF